MQPQHIEVYTKIDWAIMFSQLGQDTTLQAEYDSEIHQLTVILDYQETLNL